jgi:hypothetical protein
MVKLNRFVSSLEQVSESNPEIISYHDFNGLNEHLIYYNNLFRCTLGEGNLALAIA